MFTTLFQLVTLYVVYNIVCICYQLHLYGLDCLYIYIYVSIIWSTVLYICFQLYGLDCLYMFAFNYAWYPCVPISLIVFERQRFHLTNKKKMDGKLENALKVFIFL